MKRSRGTSPIWYFLLALLPALSFAVHFRGQIVLGWDSVPPIRPELLLQEALSAWDGRAYVGQAAAFSLTALPLALVLEALHAVFGVIFTDRIALTALFVAPAFTMYYAARALYPRFPSVWFLAGWFYALSPLLLSRFYIPIYTVALVYALTPVLVVVWLRFICGDRPFWLGLLYVTLGEIAFIPCGKNLAFWIVPQLFAFAAAAVVGGWRPEGRPQLRSRLMAGVVATMAINAFWLLPQIVFGVSSGPSLASQSVNKAYSEGVQRDVASNSSLPYTMRLSSRAMTDAGDQYGPYWTYARVLAVGPVAAAFYFVVMIALAAVAIRRRDPRALFLGAALLAAIYVMKGDSPPFSGPLQFFDRIPLLGTIFRDGYDKMVSVAGFASALLASLAVHALAARKPFHVIAFRVAAAFAVVLVFPYWTGQMFMARAQGPTLSSMPPRELFAFSQAIDDLPGRLLFVPTSENSLLLSTQWGYYGPNVYGSLTRAPFIAGQTSTLNLSDVNDLISHTYDALYGGDRTQFLQLTRTLEIRYVYVAHDLGSDYYGPTKSVARVEAFLARLPRAKIALRIGPYSLWDLSAVVDRPGSLIREPIVGYRVPLDAAIALKGRCGSGDAALVWAADADCAIAPARTLATKLPAFVVRNEMVARLSVRNGRLAGVASEDKGANPEYVAAALPANADAADVAGAIVRDASASVPVYAGAIEPVVAYRTTQDRAIAQLGDFSGPGVSLLRTSDDTVLAQTARPSWILASLHSLGLRRVFVTVRAHAYDMRYKVAVVDTSTQNADATSAETDADEATISFTPKAEHEYQAYLYLIPSQPDAVLEFRGIRAATMRAVGETTISVRRIVIAGANAVGASRIRGKTSGYRTVVTNALEPNAALTALVLNTQYDPLWFATLSQPGRTVPYLLNHVVSDGYKNAWLVPPNASGSVRVFYVNSVIWVAGLVVFALTMLVITVWAAMERITLVSDVRT